MMQSDAVASYLVGDPRLDSCWDGIRLAPRAGSAPGNCRATNGTFWPGYIAFLLTGSFRTKILFLPFLFVIILSPRSRLMLPLSSIASPLLLFLLFPSCMRSCMHKTRTRTKHEPVDEQHSGPCHTDLVTVVIGHLVDVDQPRQGRPSSDSNTVAVIVTRCTAEAAVCAFTRL